MDIRVILCTVPNADTGAEIGRALVEARLAACVNIVDGLRSIYNWHGHVHDDPEALLVIKTRASLFEPLRAELAKLHPYEVPEIVALAPTDCHQPYLDWLLEVTG
jgi:periplasmic divalent cation tolerance protein